MEGYICIVRSLYIIIYKTDRHDLTEILSMVTLNTITWLIDGDKLIVFYCLSASEVRPNKGDGLLWEWYYKRGDLWRKWSCKEGD